jgi:hypothetical protein
MIEPTDSVVYLPHLKICEPSSDAYFPLCSSLPHCTLIYEFEKVYVILYELKIVYTCQLCILCIFNKSPTFYGIEKKIYNELTCLVS